MILAVNGQTANAHWLVVWEAFYGVRDRSYGSYSTLVPVHFMTMQKRLELLKLEPLVFGVCFQTLIAFQDRISVHSLHSVVGVRMHGGADSLSHRGPDILVDYSR